MQDWLDREVVLPVLQRFADRGLTGDLGGDFAMRQDRSAFVRRLRRRSDLKRHVPLIVELRTLPYDQQKQALFWIVDIIERCGSLGGGILDANGNGMVLAQESASKLGSRRSSN